MSTSPLELATDAIIVSDHDHLSMTRYALFSGTVKAALTWQSLSVHADDTCALLQMMVFCEMNQLELISIWNQHREVHGRL